MDFTRKLMVVLGFAACSACAGTAGAVEDSVIKYGSPSGGADFVIDIKKGEIRYSSTDVVMAATFCPSSSDLYCVDSKAFHFAVPKKFDLTSKSWKSNGHQYDVVVPLAESELFGKKLKVVLIKSQATEESGATGTEYYYYAPDYGLLAYELVIQPSAGSGDVPKAYAPVVLLLENAKGIGP